VQPGTVAPQVTLLGSGAILLEVIKAAQQLAMQGVLVTVFSVTSWSELAREGQACAQQGHYDATNDSVPFVTRRLRDGTGPIIAATDYVRAVPESVRAFVPDGRSYVTLGTDGFGRSDTRAALRAFFGIDAASIAQAALFRLAQD
jgi:pyruvate dehydrogenase E1 component